MRLVIMTREQQIRQVSIEYTIKDRPMCIGGGAFSEVIDEMNRNYAFEEGAKWADRTLIEKACEWLKFTLEGDFGYYGAVDFTNNFRKAVEE